EFFINSSSMLAQISPSSSSSTIATTIPSFENIQPEPLNQQNQQDQQDQPQHLPQGQQQEVEETQQQREIKLVSVHLDMSSKKYTFGLNDANSFIKNLPYLRTLSTLKISDKAIKGLDKAGINTVQS